MNYIEFMGWLKEHRKMSERSATDVVSRCKRVLKLIGQDEVDENTLVFLLQADAYKGFSSYVKSQLKRAVTLYRIFCSEENG